MIRREFLHLMAVSGPLAAVPAGGASALEGGAGGFERMNGHLWQVYRLARAKHSVYPAVQSQLIALNDALRDGRGRAGSLRVAAGDLFQLAGELAFDADRNHDAASSYALAASASKEAGAYDLWACALIRSAYVDLSERRYRRAADTLGAARRVALRGDSGLATKYWAAAVQAEASAGLGDLNACEAALDEAEKVADLGDRELGRRMVALRRFASGGGARSPVFPAQPPRPGRGGPEGRAGARSMRPSDLPSGAGARYSWIWRRSGPDGRTRSRSCGTDGKPWRWRGPPGRGMPSVDSRP